MGVNLAPQRCMTTGLPVDSTGAGQRCGFTFEAMRTGSLTYKGPILDGSTRTDFTIYSK